MRRGGGHGLSIGLDEPALARLKTIMIGATMQIMTKTTKPYEGLLGLDRLPSGIKWLNWIICFVLVVTASFSNLSPITRKYDMAGLGLVTMAFFSPALMGAAWLRLTGVRWRYALASVFILAILFVLLRVVASLLFPD